MARVATQIKEDYSGKYQLLNEKQRIEYDNKSLLLYADALESLLGVGERRGLSQENLAEFQEAIRENIAIEAMYANPDDPQKVFSISRTKISIVAKTLFDNIYENTDIGDVFKFINQNTGTSLIRDEIEEMLKYLRFRVKYNSIGRPELENE